MKWAGPGRGGAGFGGKADNVQCVKSYLFIDWTGLDWTGTGLGLVYIWVK